ncbi:MAG: T9SS type A sorting domain-containing protein [Bacteroidota bacterium]
MKKKVLLSLFLCICFGLQVDAQEKEEKVKVKVFKEVNGKKELVEKTYNSLEEMKNDPDLKDLNIELLNGKFIKVNGGNDKDGVTEIVIDKRYEIGENTDNGVEHDVDEEGNVRIKTRAFEISVEKQEDGSYKIIKNGEPLDVESGGTYSIDSTNGGNVKIHFSGGEIRVNGEEAEGENGNVFFFKSTGEANELEVEEILEKVREKVNDAVEETIDLQFATDGEGEKEKQIKIVLKISKLTISELDFSENEFEHLHLNEQKSLQLDDLNFYPNPNSGRFTLDFQSNGAPTEVNIMDLTGKQVYNKQLQGFEGYVREEIDLTDQQPGVYILQMLQGGRSLNKKIILE